MNNPPFFSFFFHTTLIHTPLMTQTRYNSKSLINTATDTNYYSPLLFTEAWLPFIAVIHCRDPSYYSVVLIIVTQLANNHGYMYIIHQQQLLFTITFHWSPTTFHGYICNSSQEPQMHFIFTDHHCNPTTSHGHSIHVH